MSAVAVVNAQVIMASNNEVNIVEEIIINTKTSTDTLRKEVQKKSNLADDVILAMERPELLELVLKLRKEAGSRGSSPSRQLPVKSVVSDTMSLLEIMPIQWAKEDRQRQVAKEEADTQRCIDREERLEFL